MKRTIITFFTIILPVLIFSTNMPKTHKALQTSKLCIDCKYCVVNANNPQYSKCSLFPRDESRINYLVSGKLESIDYMYCSTARSTNNMCGTEGLLYKKKVEENEIRYDDDLYNFF